MDIKQAGATVWITETNIGYITFESEEEAKEWIEEPVDYDGVKWVRTTESKFELVKDQQTNQPTNHESN